MVFFRGQPPDTSQPSFPIRAAFFYPWFPRNWTQLGLYPFTRFHPTLGFYETTAPSAVRSQLTALSYGNFDAALYSWWGQGSEEDSRFSLFLDASRETSFRWAVYYEPEAYGKPTVAQLQSDLRYIRDQYAEKPAYLRVDNRPVIFVYGDESCDRAAAWEQANVIDAYLVLKVFPGYQSCPAQPDGWHQYGPAVSEANFAPDSFTISPGFWQATEAAPRLQRDLTQFDTAVHDMLISSANFQLVTTATLSVIRSDPARATVSRGLGWARERRDSNPR